MGLDLLVDGCAKPGHESEWRRLLERSFDEEDLSEAENERLQEISIPGYERIDAPRVGRDNAANQWMIDARDAKTPDEVAAVLKEFDGFYVVRLVACDGVPKYSNGGVYEGVDHTSFRGAFLNDCPNVLPEPLLNEAWEHKYPDQAVAYGKALLAAADRAEAQPLPAPAQQQGVLSRLWSGKQKKSEPIALADQLDIVRAAGRWYVFWGERGHPIRAWF